MSAPVYRRKVAAVVNRLIDAVGGHPGLLMWHVSNEFGGECFCPLCVQRFRDYLRERFDNDIEKLNRAYFQWRKGRGSFEQYHGAVVDLLGTGDTRVFREVAAVGAALAALADVRGTIVTARTALLFDWDNMWAIDAMSGLSQETKEYQKACIRM